MAVKKEESAWVNATEFAKRMGIDPSSVTAAVRAGRIRGKPHGRRLLFNWVTQSKAFINTSHRIIKPSTKVVKKNGKTTGSSAKLKSPKTPANGSLADARMHKEFYQAEKLRLEFETAQGNLINAEQASKEWQRMATTFKKALLAVPDRVSPVLAGEKRADNIHRMLTLELRHCLETLSQEAQE